eukprot:scaffold316260_cov28-Tisochrysis_lutea.AAC.2
MYGAAWPKPWGSHLMRVGEVATPAATKPASLHILGRADKTNPPEQGVEVAKYLGGEIQWHDGGHCVAADANDAVASFLQRCVPSSD